MAYFFSGQSHTFNEYLLVPGYSSSECIPDNVSLRTPLTRFRAGEEPALSLNVPMVSAVMQSVSGDRLAVALAQEGGVSFLYGSQSIEDEAAMVARVKSYKAGFVRSDSNISPDATLSDILALREQTGHSTVAVTEDGTAVSVRPSGTEPKIKVYILTIGKDETERDENLAKYSQWVATLTK